MRFKSPNKFWLNTTAPLTCLVIAAALGNISSAHALEVAALAPYITNIVGSTERAVYYPDPSLRSSTDYYLSPDFSGKTVELKSVNTALRFGITGIETSKPNIFVYAKKGSSQIKLRLDTCNDLSCTNTYFHTTSGSFTVAMTVGNICANTEGAGIDGCTVPTVAESGSRILKRTLPTNNDPLLVTTDARIPGVTLVFVASSRTDNPDNDEIDDGVTLKIYPQIEGPDLTVCPSAPYFFPSDGEILVNTNLISAISRTNTGTSPVFSRMWVAATLTSDGGLSAANYDSTAQRYSDQPLGQGEKPYPNYENSTDSEPKFYEMDIGIEDSAGVINFCGDGPDATSFPDYPVQRVFATDIQGFLRESNCFVATASFRDGRAPGVMLLRTFRDEFLSEFSLGRDFIAWYYAHGPRAAEWLLAHPTFRVVALSALLPLQAIAWVAVHPAVLFAPLTALLFLAFGLLGTRVRKRKLVSILALAVLGATPGARATETPGNQPYIDSLVSELPREQFPARTSENPDPYIQSVRKKLAKPENTDGYTDEVRKTLPARDGSEGYTERVGRGIPKTSGSAIEDYRKGKKLKANKGGEGTRSAFGFKLAAATTRTYSAGANQDVAFEQVYGDSWLPDFTFHYEKRPFTSPVLNRLGIYGSLGSAFTKADGVLDFEGDLQFRGQGSRTEFRFVSIPVNIGLMYRVNIADFIYPFFGGGPSAIGFIENRNDKKGGQRGYTFGYWFTGGVALGLDWLSPKNSWDQYETTGAKHSYLTIDYTYLESMAGGLVEFTVDGVQVGFTFEM